MAIAHLNVGEMTMVKGATEIHRKVKEGTLVFHGSIFTKTCNYNNNFSNDCRFTISGKTLTQLA